jgi:hypothetical protein
MDITSWHSQLILGSLLGSGYLVRVKKKEGSEPTYYMGISESHDPDWFAYKAGELSLVAAKTPVVESRGVLKWRSRSGSHWQEYVDQFYKKDDWGKYVTMETLDKMKDTALAVWFCDKGFWYTSRRVGLRTSAFGDANQVIHDYFNEVGLECELRKDSNGACRVIFTRHGTDRFLSTIAQRLPFFMRYRLEAPILEEK